LILDRVANDGFSRVVWINLREEAVIFVDGKTYTARRSVKLNENDLVPGITGHTIQVLENSLKSSLQEQLELHNHRFEYWHEVALHENELFAVTVNPSTVFTLPEVYATQVIQESSKIQEIQYYRIPIERENAPEQKDVEKLMKLIDQADEETAFVFNCQMGKRRTTTAMVLSKLMYVRRCNNKNTSIFSPIPFKDVSKIVGSNEYDRGNFKVIRALEKRLPFGTKAKRWVDLTIDQSASICNIRLVINEYRELSMNEAKPAKRSYFLHHALSFLERYFYLIVFGAFVLENKEQHTTFSDWIHCYPDLFRLLDDLGGVKYKSDQLLQNAVLKMDHFPGLSKIPFFLSNNAPNFRQISNEPLFGSAQCLEKGIQEVCIHLNTFFQFERVIWINLREEAIVYVAGRPFVIRHEENLLENVEYPGIEVDEIKQIENQIKIELQEKIQKAKGLFLYWHEPKEFVSEETIEHIDPFKEIKTLNEIYQQIAQTYHQHEEKNKKQKTKSNFKIKYARIPVSDETAPEEKDLDDLVRLVVPYFQQDVSTKKNTTAIVCNCQMGRGRTTTALVCLFMLRFVLQQQQQPDDNHDVTTTHQDVKFTFINNNGNIRTGIGTVTTGPEFEFQVIKSLLQVLENGQESKVLVDFAIDQCQHLQNLRDCIAQCRDLATSRDLPANKHDYYMLRAVNYLERYFYLICFGAYVLEAKQHRFKTLFVTWMNERYGTALYALLDNLCFEEEIITQEENGTVVTDAQVSSMRWRWRRKRKLISRLE
jgi:protein-tyrosine phosphatase